MQFRIGDRDPATGLYDVIWPDGSSTRNGVKIFNAAHQFDDVVLATQRSDGMMILDSVKAFAISEQTSQLSALPTPNSQLSTPLSYLTGQIWNNEDQVILPVVSVKFAPGSPTSLAAAAGNFVVRISIDRAQRKDLRVQCELTGTAPSGDYSYVGLDSNLVAVIPAGELFFDVTISPTQNPGGVDETIIVKALARRDYRIGQDNNATATIQGSSAAMLRIVRVSPLILEWGADGEELLYPLFYIERLNSPNMDRVFFDSYVQQINGLDNYYPFYDATGNPLSPFDVSYVSIAPGQTTSSTIYIKVRRYESTCVGLYTDQGLVTRQIIAVLFAPNTYPVPGYLQSTEIYTFAPNSFSVQIHEQTCGNQQ